MQHFSFGDDIGSVGEDLQHRNTARRHHQLKRARVKKIADQDACRVAEHGVGGRVAAAKGRFVDYIVVEQGRGVDHFHHCCQRVMVRSAVPARLSGEQKERRPKPLTAAGDDIFTDLADQRDVRVQGFAQHAIDCLHVVGQNRLQQGNCHGGRQIFDLGRDSSRKRGRRVA